MHPQLEKDNRNGNLPDCEDYNYVLRNIRLGHAIYKIDFQVLSIAWQNM